MNFVVKSKSLGKHSKNIIQTANVICEDKNDLASEHGISIPYAVGELIGNFLFFYLLFFIH